MRRKLFTAILAIAAVSCVQTPYFKDAYGYGPIYPDYVDVTVPATIAPLNFTYTTADADKAVTTFSCGAVSYKFRGREVEWSERNWRKLLAEASQGGDIVVRSSSPDTTWAIHVSPDPIDYGITYRLVSPGYETAGYMGIFERELSSFREKSCITDTRFDGCINCHCFNQCDPGDFSLHVRGGHSATVIRKDGRMEAFNTATDSTLAACVYPYWHPSGNYIAYSTNQTRQCFYLRSKKPLDVYDIASDLQIYDLRNNQLIVSNSIKSDDVWQNYPAFSPDGKTLYFCACPAREIPSERELTRYNLCKVSFDPETGNIGSEVETVIDAAAECKDIAFPRPSYDGRYLMYTLFDNTGFPVWHDEADLWILDLVTGERHPATRANSDGPDGYHSWSSNSKWFVFGSRRDDGRYTRAYICHMGDDGECDKAFMLPQKHPLHYYAVHGKSFNLPEFVSGPVAMDKAELQRIVTSKKRTKFGFRRSE